MRPAPRVFTIAPERPFLDALAAGLLAQHFDPQRPERLAELTVLLPTRRAARALGEVLLARAEVTFGVRALLLPAIRPLGDVDEEALSFDAAPLDAQAELELPPELPSLRRQLLLGTLVRAFFQRRGESVSEGATARLARSLAQLLDQAATHGADLGKLETLVPAAFARHWDETLAFLGILTEHWPDMVRAHDALEPATRRDALMERYRRTLEDEPHGPPVIAAGSTGTHPATARLLATIARRPTGAVILPGLDRTSPPEAWAHVGPSHPQGAMKALLAVLGIDRDEVAAWEFGASGGHPARSHLLNEALRPWESTGGWRAAMAGLAAEIPAEGVGITRIDAPNPIAEADAIALILRHALETPGRTAALVTPDRRLARGVAGALKRWGIDIDDSAGQALALTPPAVFLRLIARAGEEKLAPAALLALLKHPLCGLGMSVAECRSKTRSFERLCLRGLAPAPGLAGLRARVASLRDRRERAEAGAFLRALESRFEGLMSAFERSGRQPFADLVSLHVQTAEALADTESQAGRDRLWLGDAGEAVAELFGDLLSEAGHLPKAPAADYVGFLDVAFEGPVVRPPHGRHPRLALLGPLEARLQRADIVVLGGLNEGTWPREPAPDPWLSRVMAKEIGLPPPEQRLGLSAHDFVAIAAQARHAFFTRSEKVEGTPTIPSRWLVRLSALADGLERPDLFAAPFPYLSWADTLDAPDGPVRPEPPPAPRPPVALRPRKLSVTQVGTWIRDPYALYARHVLGLRKLRPIDEPAAANLRGDIFHEALHLFVQAGIDPRAPDALPTLIALGEDVFARHDVPMPVRMFWWPRFVTVARAFLREEARRRADGIAIAAAEVRGAYPLPGAARPFILTARADRIDRLPDGKLELIDYKTGGAPSEAQMKAGLEPQLPLEAAIAQAGGFDGIPAATVERLRVLLIKGTAEALESKEIGGVQALIDDHLERLRVRADAFDDPEMPYRASVIPLFRAGRWTGDYDHLSRLAEWSSGSDEEGS